MSKSKPSKQKEKIEQKNTQEQVGQNSSNFKLDVRINRLVKGEDKKVKAVASVNLNERFAITNIRLVEGQNGFFIAMPSFKTEDGDFKDICFPLDNEQLKELTDKIQEAYIERLAEEEKEIQQNSDKEQDSSMTMGL